MHCLLNFHVREPTLCNYVLCLNYIILDKKINEKYKESVEACIEKTIQAFVFYRGIHTRGTLIWGLLENLRKNGLMR